MYANDGQRADDKLMKKECKLDKLAQAQRNDKGYAKGMARTLAH
jgi:hypothetical protein